MKIFACSKSVLLFQADIMFVLDSSENFSPAEYAQLKEGINTLIDETFDLAPDVVRVGFVEYRSVRWSIFYKLVLFNGNFWFGFINYFHYLEGKGRTDSSRTDSSPVLPSVIDNGIEISMEINILLNKYFFCPRNLEINLHL